MKKPLLAIAALVLAACSKNIQNPEAVKQGVVDYLKQRAPTMGLDMSAMDVNVGSVSFEKDVARANVSFVPKGMPPGSGGMTMDYVLERKGDKWAVKGRQVSPGNAHGDQALPGSAQPDSRSPDSSQADSPQADSPQPQSAAPGGSALPGSGPAPSSPHGSYPQGSATRGSDAPRSRPTGTLPPGHPPTDRPQ